MVSAFLLASAGFGLGGEGSSGDNEGGVGGVTATTSVAGSL